MALSIEEQRAIVAKSDALYKAGDLTAPMAVLDSLIGQKTDYFRPYHNLGFFHRLQADYVRAEHYFSGSSGSRVGGLTGLT